jgi:hypothetical protein
MTTSALPASLVISDSVLHQRTQHDLRIHEVLAQPNEISPTRTGWSCFGSLWFDIAGNYCPTDRNAKRKQRKELRLTLRYFGRGA